jgi:hypothetical protein
LATVIDSDMIAQTIQRLDQALGMLAAAITH